MNIQEFTRSYLNNLKNLLDNVDENVVASIVEQLEKIVEKNYKNNHFILCPGKVYGYRTVKSNYGIDSFLNDIKKNILHTYNFNYEVDNIKF